MSLLTFIHLCDKFNEIMLLQKSEVTAMPDAKNKLYLFEALVGYAKRSRSLPLLLYTW